MTTQLETKTQKLTLAALFLALTIVAQISGRFYPDVTKLYVGPIINALLILAAIYTGPVFSLLLAFLSPILAFVTGQLNPAMAPFIPFIIAGNLLFVLVFIFSSRPFGAKNTVKQIIGIVLGSLLKFALLALAARYAVSLFHLNIPGKIALKLPVAFGLVQLYAALAGGFIALVLSAVFKKRRIL